MPCPFCGHENIDISEIYSNNRNCGWCARCEYCDAQVSGFDTEKSVIEFWNKRFTE